MKQRERKKRVGAWFKEMGKMGKEKRTPEAEKETGCNVDQCRKDNKCQRGCDR